MAGHSYEILSPEIYIDKKKYSTVMDFTAEYGLKTSQVASWIWKRRGVLYKKLNFWK